MNVAAQAQAPPPDRASGQEKPKEGGQGRGGERRGKSARELP